MPLLWRRVRYRFGCCDAALNRSVDRPFPVALVLDHRLEQLHPQLAVLFFDITNEVRHHLLGKSTAFHCRYAHRAVNGLDRGKLDDLVTLAYGDPPVRFLHQKGEGGLRSKIE